MKRLVFQAALASLLLAPGIGYANDPGLIQTRAVVSETLASYKPITVLSGPVKLAATDAISDTAVEWRDLFKKFHPQAQLGFSGLLTPDAVKGFIDDVYPLTITARDMTAEEMSAFQAKHGYAPIRIPVCMDTVIVFVNKNNPIKEISLDQLDAIYSTTRLTGARIKGETWGELGLRGEWRERPIHAYTRQEGAALRTWFAANVMLKGGKYKESVRSANDSMGLAEAVVTDPNAIAHGPLQAWFASVKVIPVAPREGQQAQPPTQKAVYEGKYPLARAFHLFINRAPDKPLSPVAMELVRFMLSREGQEALADTGFIPSPAEFVTSGLKRLE